MRKSRFFSLVVIPLCLAGAFFALQAEAVGEEIGGQLTGKMNIANYFGALLLLISIALVLMRSSYLTFAIMVSWVLIIPMQSWRLFPGWWCSDGNCAIHYDMAVWNSAAVMACTLPPLAILLLRLTR
jgi:hypothetical protein